MKRTLPNTSFKRLPFVYLLAVFAAGVLFQHFFPGTNFRFILFSFLTLLATSISLLPFKKQNLPLSTTILFAALFFSGILLSTQTDIKKQKSWLGHTLQQTSDYYAEVIDNPEIKPKTIKLTLAIHKARREHHWENVSGKILLYIFNKGAIPKISKGDFILFPNKLEHITNRGNPFEFDYAGYLDRKGFYYQAFLNPEKIYIKKSERPKPNMLEGLHVQLLSSIQKNIKDAPTAAITAATLLNERTFLDGEIWKAYSVTGIAHIIAISGMHVSLFFGIILAMLWWLKAPKFRWIKYLLGLPIVWGYIVITGFPPSAVRAAVMFTIIFVCLSLRKEQNPLNFLAATGFLLLCFNPLWLLDTGIQLSFAAVASIFLFYKPIYRLWQPQNKFYNYLWNAVSVSLAVQILVFPIVVFYFHQFPIWFLMSNIPASVYSLLLMIMGLLLFLLDGLGIPCVWLGDLMEKMTYIFHQFIFLLAEHTPQTMRQLYLNSIEFWILLLSIIFMCLFIFFKKSKYALAGLSLLCILLTLFLWDNYKTMKQEKIIVYNSSKVSLIDYFKGNKCYSIALRDCSLATNVSQYILLPSRLAAGIRNISKAGCTSAFKRIRGKRILFLNQNIDKKAQIPFPVDYLILGSSCTLHPQQWKKIFRPKEIILDSSFPRWKAEQWKKALSQQNIPAYFVGTDGAWIFPKEKE